MGMKFGTLDVVGIKVGSSTVNKIYQGTNLIYQLDVDPPSVPTGFSANNATPNSLTWTASTDNITPQNEIQYYIERADDINFTINNVVVKNWVVGNTGFDDVVPTLVVGNTYYYRVKARDNQFNESAYNSPTSSLIIESGSVNLGYHTTTDSSACIATQNIYYYTGGSTWLTATEIWTESNFSLPPPAGYLSDSTTVRYWDGNSFTSTTACP